MKPEYERKREKVSKTKFARFKNWKIEAQKKRAEIVLKGILE